jgi:hypothetical protein
LFFFIVVGSFESPQLFLIGWIWWFAIAPGSDNQRQTSCVCRLSIIENFCDLFDRVPIARGGWHAEERLDLAEVADRSSSQSTLGRRLAGEDRCDPRQIRLGSVSSADEGSQ